jgi:hypothetical protein
MGTASGSVYAEDSSALKCSVTEVADDGSIKFNDDNLSVEINKDISVQTPAGKGVKLGRGNKKDCKRSADEKRWGMSRAELEKRVLRLYKGGTGIVKIGKTLGVGTGTVQRVVTEQPRPFDVDVSGSLNDHGRVCGTRLHTSSGSLNDHGRVPH